MQLLKRADWRAIPWKNGLGITHELYREPGPSQDRFALRLSAARVEIDSPFSSFPGIDRTILMLEGRGFDLTRADGAVACIRSEWPFSFHGEDAWSCKLVDGPVLDFNVMVDRSLARATVHLATGHLATGHRASDRVRTAILALEVGVRVGDRALEQHDLAWFDGAAEVVGRCVVVQSTRTP